MKKKRAYLGGRESPSPVTRDNLQREKLWREKKEKAGHPVERGGRLQTGGRCRRKKKRETRKGSRASPPKEFGRNVKAVVDW